MAEHHVGELFLACFANRLVESVFEPLAHLGRHVAITCCLVRHLVAHAAHGKGQLGRAEAHGAEGDSLGKGNLVGGVDAGNERHFVPCRRKCAHRFGDVDAASGAVGLLRSDDQDVHAAFPPKSAATLRGRPLTKSLLRPCRLGFGNVGVDQAAQLIDARAI